MVILELIHAKGPDSCGRDVFIRFKTNAGVVASVAPRYLGDS